jgi:hypothetical protein
LVGVDRLRAIDEVEVAGNGDPVEGHDHAPATGARKVERARYKPDTNSRLNRVHHGSLTVHFEHGSQAKIGLYGG